MSNDWGKDFLARRVKHGIKVDEIAVQAGMTAVRLWQIELSDREPSQDERIALNMALLSLVAQREDEDNARAICREHRCSRVPVPR